MFYPIPGNPIAAFRKKDFTPELLDVNVLLTLSGADL